MLRVHDIKSFINQSHRIYFHGHDADAAFITKLFLAETDVEVSPPQKDGGTHICDG